MLRPVRCGELGGDRRGELAEQQVSLPQGTRQLDRHQDCVVLLPQVEEVWTAAEELEHVEDQPLLWSGIIAHMQADVVCDEGVQQVPGVPPLEEPPLDELIEQVELLLVAHGERRLLAKSGGTAGQHAKGKKGALLSVGEGSEEGVDPIRQRQRALFGLHDVIPGGADPPRILLKRAFPQVLSCQGQCQEKPRQGLYEVGGRLRLLFDGPGGEFEQEPATRFVAESLDLAQVPPACRKLGSQPR
jgi:hypothetical protein